MREDHSVVNKARNYQQLTFGAVLAAILTASAIAGCAGGSAYGGGGGGGGGCVYGCASPSPMPSATPSPGTHVVGLSLGAPPTTDPTYGKVLGYFVGTNPSQSQIITLQISSGTNVQFTNVDTAPHTASNLGTWSGDGNKFPSSFNNPTGANPSPAGTDISMSTFSSGAVLPSSSSATYTANVPGVYVFVCAFHYVSNHMRTVIIVM
jgi:plastocyanin